MAMYKVEDIRNIAFCGHKSCGKTTLVDRMLTHTGAVSRAASVDEGTSICDFDEEEKSHRYTIEAKLTHFDHAGKHFHAIDTPGYPDFIGQTIGALRGVDTAAIVINAQAGIEVNTRRVFAEAGKAGVGRMIVINRMDADNIEFPKLIKSIKELFGAACVLLNVPLGQGADFRGVAGTLDAARRIPAGALVDPKAISESLVESIIVADEAVMERYLEGTPPSQEELSHLMIQAIAKGTLIPIVCVSGKTGAGFPGTLGRHGPLLAAAGQGGPQGHQAGRRRGGGQGRSQPARWWPRSSRPASTPSCRSSVSSASTPASSPRSPRSRWSRSARG